MDTQKIFCVGETLWDSLPKGLFLGGAPFNVAVHLHTLGEQVAIVSCVGDDVLGKEILRRLVQKGISTELIQTHAQLPTGLVQASIDEDGDATYEILEPVAWDEIALDDSLLKQVAGQTVVFGSLAQRSKISRKTIYALCEAGGFRIFDVNLRPPFDDSAAVKRSLGYADLVKLNEDELKQLGEWFALPASMHAAAEALAKKFECQAVCITKGSEGAALWNEGVWTEHKGYSVSTEDTVGAGDAFLAAFISGFLAGKEDQKVLARANRIGAYVAAQFGATPDYDYEKVKRAVGGNGHTYAS